MSSSQQDPSSLVSWRDVAAADEARWAYRVAEARSAAVDAEPTSGDEQRWAASVDVDRARYDLDSLIRHRSLAAEATLEDWPAVVISDVDLHQLPDEIVAGHVVAGPSWYEQVRGITVPDIPGPTLAASVPAPADGRDWPERATASDLVVLDGYDQVLAPRLDPYVDQATHVDEDGAGW